MTNLLNSTLTHLTVDDAIFEYKCIEQNLQFKSFSHTDQLAICGDTLAIMKQRL